VFWANVALDFGICGKLPASGGAFSPGIPSGAIGAGLFGFSVAATASFVLSAGAYFFWSFQLLFMVYQLGPALTKSGLRVVLARR
jgi:hypothetical protein